MLIPSPGSLLEKTYRLTSNSNLNLNTSLDVDNDLLDNLGGGVEVDETLVDLHLEHVPGLGALTTRSLAGGDLKVLGRQTDGALDAQLLALGALDELAAHLLEGRDLLAGEGDADLVDLGRIALRRLLGVLERHFRVEIGVVFAAVNPTGDGVRDCRRSRGSGGILTSVTVVAR